LRSKLEDWGLSLQNLDDIWVYNKGSWEI
jgi:hypothetical protein